MRLSTAIAIGLLLIGIARASAVPAEVHCVSCSEPDRVYRCIVEIPKISVPTRALQLFCVIQLARENGHKRCVVRRQDDAANLCADTAAAVIIERHYVYRGPLPGALRALSRTKPPAPDGTGTSAAGGTQAGKGDSGEPHTLVEFTNRAVEASGKTIKKAGDTVVGATRNAGRTVGNVARTAGGKVGTVAKKTGRAVGGAAKSVGETIKGAAKSAYDCVRSFFKDCN